MSTRAAVVVFLLWPLLAASAMAQTDDALLGRWTGTGATNKGEELTFEKTEIVIGDRRVPYKLQGQGVLVLGGDDGDRVDYQIDGDKLTLTTAEGSATYARAGKPAAPPAAPPAAGGSNPLAKKPAADVFARPFKGDGIELALTGNAKDGYRGTLVFQGQRYDAEAQAKGDNLGGRFRAGEQWFDFTATLAGDALTLASGGSTYKLAGEPIAPVAEAPQNPLARGGGAPADASFPPLADVFAGTTTRFEHPRGWFGFDMPEGWTVYQQNDTGMVLNPGFTAASTLDAMVGLMWGRLEPEDQNQPVAKVTARWLPRLRQMLAEQGLTIGDDKPAIETFRGRDVPGTVVTMKGTSRNGSKVLVWCGGMVKRDSWIAVNGVVLQGKEDGYLPKLKRIFASLEPKPPEHNAALEQALVGRSFSSSQYGRVTNSASHATYAFSGGNQVSRRLMTNIAAEPGLPGASADVERIGRYEVCGDVLYLYFETGQEAGQVVVEGGQVQGIRIGSADYR